MSVESTIALEIDKLQNLLLAKNYLRKISTAINRQTAIVSSLKDKMEEEYKDVERLQKKSLNALFQKVLGTKTSRLEFEKQEYLHAVLEYKAANESLELLHFEAKILNEKVANIPIQKERLEQLVLHRESQILESNYTKHIELLAAYKELDASFSMKREIFEAKDAGLKSRKICLDILALFKKAATLRNWGGSSSERNRLDHSKLLMERSHVDRATSQFQKLKILLNKFHEELDDIYKTEKLNLVAPSVRFDSYVNSYHNYLINDWVVKQKIESILNLIDSLHSYIERLLGSVELFESKHLDKIDELKSKIENLLMLR